MNASTIHYYKTHSKNLAKRYESVVVTELHNFLKSVFPSGAKLLEIGCGTGRDAAYLLSNGFDVVATDNVQEMLESAVHHHPELLGRLHKNEFFIGQKISVSRKFSLFDHQEKIFTRAKS